MSGAAAIRLAVTGAPGTGTSTVTAALSTVTGLPRIAVDPVTTAPPPGRRLGTTVEVPVRAFEQRVDNEARQLDGFISDGTVLHEWAIAEAIRQTSRNSRPGDWVFRIFEKRFLAAHAGIVSRHARATYTAFVHLRFEPSTADADNIDFHGRADRILLDTLHSSGVPYLVAGVGDVAAIVAHIVDSFHLPCSTSVAEAVSAVSGSREIPDPPSGFCGQ